jgi:starch phosphorylase
MKAATNGALNLSVLDGWWCEAYDGENGWAIGNGQSYEDLDYQDRSESEALYGLLEHVVSPMFYERGGDGLPREWLRRIKASMLTICPVFNTNRAAEEYTRMFYIPALVNWNCLLADELTRARRIAQWKANLRQRWAGVQVLDVESGSGVDLAVGDRLTVRAQVALGTVSPEDVNVEIFYGTLQEGRIMHGRASLMAAAQSQNGVHEYSGVVNCHTSGHFGFSVRVTPRSTGLEDSFDRELIKWWDAAVRSPGVLVH